MSQNNRVPEIDILRGLAIMGMVIYHFLFDLNLLGLYSINLHTTVWKIYVNVIGFTFIFLVGISLWLSYQTSRLRHNSTSEIKHAYTSRLFKYLSRGIFIFFLGMTITIITYIIIPDMYIIFGILHLIGLSIILSIPFLKRSKWIVFGVSLIILTIKLWTPFVGYYSDIWELNIFQTILGFPTINRTMADYYPLIPWFGVTLLGIYTGQTLYPKPKSIFPTYITHHLSFINLLGRHSLLIYLIHQPIIISVILLFI